MAFTRTPCIATGIALAVVILVLPTISTAQHRFDHWYFGTNAGVDFSQGAPVPLTDGRLSTLEGSAAISDDVTGDLLFYTDGVTVWDKTHTVMPNGRDLKGHWTSSQSALIVPIPGSSSRCFLFTAGAGLYHTTDDPNNGIRYSIVDMALNGGNGDVVEKNVELIARGDATEMLNATKHCNGIDYWVIAHELENNRFHAYLIDQSGIADTVITDIGGIRSGDLGTQSMAKFSPNGRMLTVATPGDKSLELYDFDNESGTLSNFRALGTDYYYYGPEFSPDNSKLYSSTLAFSTEPDYLYQFDLTAGNLAAIQQSRAILHTENGRWRGAQCQLGPDGRIYVSFIDRTLLGVIEQPNQSGTAASYDHDGLDLAGRTTQYGLPNSISADFLPPQKNDTALRITIESDSDTIGIGGVSTLRLIVCNNSSTPLENVTVNSTLPLGLVRVSGATFPLSISSLAPLACDTFSVSVSLGQVLSDTTEFRMCGKAESIPASTCALPLSSEDCRQITGLPAPVDTSAVDYTFYPTPGCPGTEALINVPFNSRRYTDTITSVTFTGPDGRFFEYAGSRPISFAIIPTRDQMIPVRVMRQHTGEVTSVMEMRTKFGDLFRVRIVAVAKPAESPIFDVTEIHAGNQQSGVRDTCIVITSTFSRAVKITDTLWFHGSGRQARLKSPVLPFIIVPGESREICLEISGDGQIQDTLMFGGAENVSFCPHCVMHSIVIDNLTPGPISGIADFGGPRRLESASIAPNPVTSQAVVSLSITEADNYTVLVYDLSGRTVTRIASSRMEIGSYTLPLETENLAAGEYWVEVRGSSRSLITQFIVY